MKCSIYIFQEKQTWPRNDTVIEIWNSKSSVFAYRISYLSAVTATIHEFFFLIFKRDNFLTTGNKTMKYYFIFILLDQKKSLYP